jgi:hypothetical protein
MKNNHELARAAAEKWFCDDLDVYNYEVMVQIIADTYAEAFPQWIACSERMPNEFETVILNLDDGVNVGYLTSDGVTFMLLPLGCLTKYVTRWQPLPEPPEVTT